jgi:hypothetical protein
MSLLKQKQGRESKISLSQIPVRQTRLSAADNGGVETNSQEMAMMRAAQSENIWEQREIKLGKAKAKIWSFLALLALVLPIVMMMVTVLKVLPSAFLDYGGIYFFLFIPPLILNMITASKRVRGLYTLSLVLTVVCVFIAAWLLFVSIYQTVGCYNGWLVSSCTDYPAVRWIVVFTTGFLLLFVVLALVHFILLVFRLYSNPRQPGF